MWRLSESARAHHSSAHWLLALAQPLDLLSRSPCPHDKTRSFILSLYFLLEPLTPASFNGPLTPPKTSLVLLLSFVFYPLPCAPCPSFPRHDPRPTSYDSLPVLVPSVSLPQRSAGDVLDSWFCTLTHLAALLPCHHIYYAPRTHHLSLLLGLCLFVCAISYLRTSGQYPFFSAEALRFRCPCALMIKFPVCDIQRALSSLDPSYPHACLLSEMATIKNQISNFPTFRRLWHFQL